jgi:hypothetical protein
MPPLELADDDRVAKLLSTRAGQLGFAAVAGVLILETVTQLRAVVEMGAAWQRHVVGPARRRNLEEMRAAGVIDTEDQPAPESAAAQIDGDEPAPTPAGDPTPGNVTSWGAPIPTSTPRPVVDHPQA